MSRPRSLFGLLWRLARLRPALVVVPVTLLATGGALGWLALDDESECTLSSTEWTYGQWRYDYIEALRLREGGAGTYLLGWDQAVRQDLSFQWEQRGEALIIRDVVDHVAAGDEAQTPFVIDEGEFVFETEHPYDERREYRYRCRLGVGRFVNGRALVLYGEPL